MLRRGRQSVKYTAHQNVIMQRAFVLSNVRGKDQDTSFVRSDDRDGCRPELLLQVLLFWPDATANIQIVVQSAMANKQFFIQYWRQLYLSCFVYQDDPHLFYCRTLPN